MNRLVLIPWILLLSAILFGCAPKMAPREKPIMPEALPKEPEAPLKEPWQVEWENTLTQARKEGSLVVSSRRSEATREIMGSAFKNKYGIDIIWMTGPTGQRAARIGAERRVGIFTNDVGIDGVNIPFILYKQWGILEALPPSFILPEVKDQSVWLDAKWPFIDRDTLIFALTLYPQSPIMYNINLVKPEEFSSYMKLLDPKWKGKFISKDFTMEGGAQKWFRAMVEEDFGPILGLDYMRALAKQEPVVIRDDRLSGDWLLRGKYPFGFNLAVESQIAEWRRSGIPVPLQPITPKEGGYVTVGGQALYFFKDAPHPNAARLFINWVLSKEGAKVTTKATVKHTTRIDIDTLEAEPEAIIRQPGVKYVNIDQEKYLLKEEEYDKLGKEIFGHLIR